MTYRTIERGKSSRHETSSERPFAFAFEGTAQEGI
jgi:hypothetical protein